MRMWFDFESQEIVTEDELRKGFEEVKESEEYDGITFEDYVWNCQSFNNGCLMEIENAYLFQHV